MSLSQSRIHPTAIIDPAAELADDVTVGPFSMLEGPVRLGPGCIVRAKAHLIGPLTAGPENDFGLNVVIGERAQHLLLAEMAGRVEIGANNVFRENATVHRSTQADVPTRIGDGNYFMVGTHVGHDCVVGNHCIFVNGSMIGGHVVIEDRALLSGNCSVHQKGRVGRLALLSAAGTATKDLPPFAIQEGRNRLVGVNLVGMRRAGLNNAQIHAVQQAYRILLHSGLMMREAVARIEKELGHIDTAAEIVKFIRICKRGICTTRGRRERAVAENS
ncbi:MAG TPA: acyl-ACP--UDP-N-acetylglucosamine O-acyltransferase [Gemmataceae bacterium]|nr:acyl-ACP--UDP-N-acetylglucosamine O-acyltransferase [Gemmataceae bacterium]